MKPEVGKYYWVQFNEGDEYQPAKYYKEDGFAYGYFHGIDDIQDADKVLAWNPTPITRDPDKTDKELGQIFDDNSNCYADSDDVVIAMDKERFIKTVREITPIPRDGFTPKKVLDMFLKCKTAIEFESLVKSFNPPTKEGKPFIEDRDKN